MPTQSLHIACTPSAVYLRGEERAHTLKPCLHVMRVDGPLLVVKWKSGHLARARNSSEAWSILARSRLLVARFAPERHQVHCAPRRGMLHTALAWLGLPLHITDGGCHGAAKRCEWPQHASDERTHRTAHIPPACNTRRSGLPHECSLLKMKRCSCQALPANERMHLDRKVHSCYGLLRKLAPAQLRTGLSIWSWHF